MSGTIVFDFQAHLRMAKAIYAVGFEGPNGEVPDIEKIWAGASHVQKDFCMRQAAAGFGALMAATQSKSETNG